MIYRSQISLNEDQPIREAEEWESLTEMEGVIPQNQ